MAVPPVPPRPFDDYDDYIRHSSTSPAPAVPPLPPDFDPVQQDFAVSAPHFEDPLVAPRPHKLQPDLPANMARNLDEQLTQTPAPEVYRGRSPQPPLNQAPGFVVPPRSNSRGPPTIPPSQGSEWSPWAPVISSATSSTPQMPQHQTTPYPPQPSQHHHHATHHTDSLPSSFATLSMSDAQYQPRVSSAYSTYGPPALPPQQPANTSAPPSLTASLPTVSSLSAQLSAVQQSSSDPGRKVAWCRDILSLVDRVQQLIAPPDNSSVDVPSGPARIDDPELQRLVNVAVALVTKLASQQQTPLPLHVAEAVYLLATCEASGAYPQFVQQNPRSAFRHYEQAAKAGYHAAWFKLGRDYENFGDATHAKQCFERGVKYGVESCLYRMGMANLMGQLGLPANPEAALPFLHRAATLATIEVPQPAYVYGLLLLNEFTHVSIPPQLFTPFVPPGSSPQAEARKHLERAAYLNFAPAQYKLGHAYEFAMPPFPFDALLSVQYYSLASQQGEIEADMALSKWFLCGSEGAFDKDEALAWTFAEKAARKGLPSAEFAMGYYAEVGVGGPKDIEAATKWYTRASQHGNTDASDRLQALFQPLPESLSREQHENLTDSRLVRKRTQAKQRSEAQPMANGHASSISVAHSQRIVHNVRKNSLIGAQAPMGRAGVAGVGAGGGYGAVGTSGPTMGRPDQHHQRISGPVPANAPLGQSPVDPSLQVAQASPSIPGGQRPFANAPRYTLVDPGSRSASPSARPNHPESAAPFRAQGRQAKSGGGGENTSGSSGPDVQHQGPPPKRGPQTFEEMGIASAKLEEKECIIM
ncbi:hypothetical protein AcV5_003348 [Taiwanofungus camphoratus]|nr:hypothetical protein AcV5_003348 [Antrodia cinnamomea]KAI0935157.1 hypothetical protein AcV7_004042 [Antrodia cinnamomea]